MSRSVIVAFRDTFVNLIICASAELTERFLEIGNERFKLFGTLALRGDDVGGSAGDEALVRELAALVFEEAAVLCQLLFQPFALLVKIDKLIGRKQRASFVTMLTILSASAGTSSETITSPAYARRQR